MKKIEKFVVIKMLEIFKKKDCTTIDDVINLLNKELKNNTDIVFSWKVGN